MELKNVMAEALSFEEKGMRLYSEAQEKSTNPVVKKTFSYLALQEKKHADDIKHFMDKNDVTTDGDSEEDAMKFFSMTVNEFREMAEAASDDDVKAFSAALELESKGYEFYKEKLAKASDARARDFLGFLMEQENIHFRFVQKTLRFIEDPVGFHAEEEGWMADGG